MKIRFFFPLILLNFSINVGLSQDIQLIENDSINFISPLEEFAKGNNHRRYKYVRNYFEEKDSFNNLIIKTEAIDWSGVYRNVVIEKKGETDSVVYIVSHYDKIDGNILSMFNFLINGSLDILTSNTFLSKGAYDNGTGVVTSLLLLSAIKDKKMHYTYRFVYTGMEEYGLRGARTHVSGVKKKNWSKNLYAINLDMIGKKIYRALQLPKI